MILQLHKTSVVKFHPRDGARVLRAVSKDCSILVLYMGNQTSVVNCHP